MIGTIVLFNNNSIYAKQAIWRDFDNMKDLVAAIRSGEKNDNNINWEKFQDSGIYQNEDKDSKECLQLAHKIGNNLGDYEIVHCFRDENYFKNKYTEPETPEPQPETNASLNVPEPQPETNASLNVPEPQPETNASLNVPEPQPETNASLNVPEPQPETNASLNVPEPQPETNASLNVPEPQPETNASLNVPEPQPETNASLNVPEPQPETNASLNVPEPQPETNASLNVPEPQPETNASLNVPEPQPETNASLNVPEPQPETNASLNVPEPQPETNASVIITPRRIDLNITVGKDPIARSENQMVTVVALDPTTGKVLDRVFIKLEIKDPVGILVKNYTGTVGNLTRTFKIGENAIGTFIISATASQAGVQSTKSLPFQVQ